MKSTKAKTGSVVKVDAALKRAWTAQLRRFEQAAKQDALAFDEKYEAIGEIISHDPPLYLAGGCANFREFVDKHVHEDESVVRQWVEVARRATPEEEARYSPTRLAALLGMLRAQSKTGTLPERIDWKKLRVPVRVARGPAKTLTALDATIAQIRQARKDILRVGGHVAPGQSALQTAVRDALEGIGLSMVTVRWTDGVFAFGGVPGYELREFAHALLTAAQEPTAATAPAKKKSATKKRSSGK